MEKRVWWYKLSSLRGVFIFLFLNHIWNACSPLSVTVHLSVSFLPRRLFLGGSKQNHLIWPVLYGKGRKSVVTFWHVGGFKISLQAPVSYLKKGWASITPSILSIVQVFVRSLLIKAKALCQETAWVV